MGNKGAIVVAVTNPKVLEHEFLTEMYSDGYFPHPLVDKVKTILRIEVDRPADLAALYTLTHAATEEFNALQTEFEVAGSEIETVARDVIGGEFWFVATAYGFDGADIEELIATRDW